MSKKEEEVKAIAKVEEAPLAPIPLDLDKTLALADAFSKSGMFPGITDQFQAMAIMEQGRILGLPAIISLGVMTPVKGRICIESKALAALAKRRGMTIEIVKRDEKECTLKFSKKGEGEHTETFTMEDAKRAGLSQKQNYMMYPKVMLHQRCLAFGLRVFDPGLGLGLYTTEEIEELSPSKPSQGKIKDPKKEEPAKGKVSFKKSKENKEEPKEKTEEEAPPKPEPEEPEPEEPPKEPLEEKPEGEHAKEFEEVIAEIKKMLKTKAVDEKIFKQYLGQDLQLKKDRQFVARNVGGHWSFHMGNMDDLKLLTSHLDWIIDGYLESDVFKKMAQQKEPSE